MVKKRKTWGYNSSKPAMPEVPEAIKMELEPKAAELIESVFKPAHIKPPPKDESWNYIVDIYTKWYRGYFYFCAKYACPGPNAIAPFFEVKSAHMEYTGDGHFSLSYMRHTEKWWELYTGLTIDECLAEIKDDPHFFP